MGHMSRERRKKRAEREQKRLERIKVLEEIDRLLYGSGTGWENMDTTIRELGEKLEGNHRSAYFPDDLSYDEFDKFLKMAKQNGIPAVVFKDRLRRGNEAKFAATKPYYPYKKNKKDQ